MEEQILQQIGLNSTQAEAYLALLKQPDATPPELAKMIGVTRTNAYELLDQLLGLELVIKEERGSKYTFKAKSPTALKRMLLKRQQSLRSQLEQLDGILPSLLSTYRLTQDQPGVLHLEGKQGLWALYDDIIRQKDEVLIFPSQHDRDNEEIVQAIDEQIARQVQAGIQVRAIYPRNSKFTAKDVKLFDQNLVNIRLFSDTKFPGQIMVYGNNIAMNTFRESIVTIIITNPELAETMRVIFEVLWNLGKGIWVTEAFFEF